MSLREYNKKRDFSSTNEPEGNVKQNEDNNFVIQYHKARANHYDFRLQYNGVLLSWAVPKGLSTNPSDKRLAVHVEDHPVDYIDFEGIIPKGNYGAGTVEIFDQGNYLPIKDFKQGLKKGHLKFVLNGKKFKGAWSLIKTNDNNWLIVKIDDKYAKAVKQKKSKLPFKTCEVEKATLSNTIPKGNDWIFEIKYDGYRIVSYVENGKVKLLTRNQQDYTNKFKNIKNALANLDAENCVLDGEIVVFDDAGKSDFGKLQTAIKTGKNNFCYVIFDLLALNGEDLRHLPLAERKEKLERLLYKSSEYLMYSSHVENGKESFNFAKKNNLEGIIAKNKNSAYIGKRTEDWLKIKCYMRQEFVIGGYTTSSKNEQLSALLLGYFEDEKFKYVGKVGTGFNELDKKELVSKFKKLSAKTCPFEDNIKFKNAQWLKPQLVCEIQFAQLTKDNLLRQPSFIALRTDKPAKDVKLEIENEIKNNKSW